MVAHNSYVHLGNLLSGGLCNFDLDGHAPTWQNTHSHHLVLCTVLGGLGSFAVSGALVTLCVLASEEVVPPFVLLLLIMKKCLSWCMSSHWQNLVAHSEYMYVMIWLKLHSLAESSWTWFVTSSYEQLCIKILVVWGVNRFDIPCCTGAKQINPQLKRCARFGSFVSVIELNWTRAE